MNKHLYTYLFLIISMLSLQCQPSKNNQTENASQSISLNSSPVVVATESIAKMQVESGFEVKLVASEPLISTPVAMVFDDRDRIWAAEMENYMPDTIGTGENIPTGKIVILEDKNKDGVMDARQIFLDSLVLPRALCLIENGLLVVSSSKLWYYQIKDDKPVNKTLVDGAYAEGGNVEHQPNGLLRGLDNWIYSANSTKSYRKKGNKWITDNTHFRGQWGISQDNYGRLIYNGNSDNVKGDYYTPMFGAQNPNQKNVNGFNEKIVTDNRVYPSRPTPGVNRGYLDGILDSTLRLKNFTAACGPVVYRGNLFGNAYQNNVFVAEPSANLIKRNVISTNGNLVTGKQAYQQKEFLTSTDERFRPVNLYNAPNGAVYVVDMYRGIIQHKTYLTDYLRGEIKRRQLSKPLACGRIYKIVPTNSHAIAPKMPDDAIALVKLLADRNGWVRDKAQQQLIDKILTAAIPALQQVLKSNTNQLQMVHAIWTLEGLGALTATDVLVLLNNKAWPIKMQALSAIPSVINKSNSEKFVVVLKSILAQKDSLTMPYIAFLASAIQPYNQNEAHYLLLQVAKINPSDKYLASAIVSNLKDKEAGFLKEIMPFAADTSLVIQKELRRTINSRKESLLNADAKNIAKQFPKGASLFNSTCQTCHGTDGNGRQSLAPPLNRSEWVNGNPQKLISIVLYGLTGPVTVNGHLYKAPEINGDMPGLGYGKEVSDEEIAQVLSYIRKSWSNKAGIISTAEVTSVRATLKGRKNAFTVQELGK